MRGGIERYNGGLLVVHSSLPIFIPPSAENPSPPSGECPLSGECGLTRSSEKKLETTKLFAVTQVAANVQNAAEPFTVSLAEQDRKSVQTRTNVYKCLQMSTNVD